MFYFDRTSKELLKIVEKLNFKGYEQHFLKNSNGDLNILKNFFIWKKTGKKEFIRITLLNNFKPRMTEELLYFWNGQFFKPFNYKHNHKKENSFNSISFKPNDKEAYLSRFLEAVKQIKLYTDRKLLNALKVNKNKLTDRIKK